MVRLQVNVDHVATVRQARRAAEPDPVHAASLAELAGATGITVHLREDRRHIQDRDVEVLRRTIRTAMNLEMAATEEMVEIALRVGPEQVTLVPERREELTTEGGLDVIGQREAIRAAVLRLAGAGIGTSLFIEAAPDQIQASRDVGAHAIEFHTGRYAAARPGTMAAAKELQAIQQGVSLALEEGLLPHAGHGLDYWNTGPLVQAAPDLVELNIGHSIVSRALFTGMETAVRDMVRVIEDALRKL